MATNKCCTAYKKGSCRQQQPVRCTCAVKGRHPQAADRNDFECSRHKLVGQGMHCSILQSGIDTCNRNFLEAEDTRGSEQPLTLQIHLPDQSREVIVKLTSTMRSCGVKSCSAQDAQNTLLGHEDNLSIRDLDI